MICKTTVRIPGDKHVVVKDMDEKDELLSKGYYHIQCFRERINGASNLKRLQEQAMGFISGAKKKMGIEEEEVMVI